MLALCLSGLTAQAQNYPVYDRVIPTTATTVKTVIDGNGRILPTNRSYVIGLEGGTRGPIVLQNWIAPNPLYPVIVVNKHGTGRVVISDLGGSNTTGIVIENCAFFKLLGNNDPAHYYGIEVARAGGAQRGISAGYISTNIEIAYTEVHDVGFAGIMAKTDPVESKPETWTTNYTMRDVYIHDNYVHDTGGEGMYIGLTGWSTDNFASVPGYESHEIKGLKVGYNLIARTGWDGFQYSSAPDDPSASDDDAEIFNNVIHKPAQLNALYQNAGFVIGGGAGGKVYNNVIIGGPGAGMSLFGRGYNTIYNNLIVGGGMFTDNRGSADPRRTVPGSYQSVYNNTFIVPAGHAYWTMNEVTVNNFKNNVSLVSDLAYTDAFADVGTTINTAGNLLLRNTTGTGFVDPTEDDYRIQTPSSAADIGVSLDSLPLGEVSVTTDFQNLARPVGAYDAGLSEAGALSVYLVSTPPTTGNTGSIKASTIGGTSPYTYAWSNSATTQTISSLPQGLYSVTVTDAVGAKMTRATCISNGAEMGAPVRVTPLDEVLVPTMSPGPGSSSTAQTVTLSTATPGASIRYTTDGSTPTATTGTVYTDPIHVPNTTVITAVGYKSAMVTSLPAAGTFIIDNGPTNTKFTGIVATESSHTSSNVVANSLDGNLATSWASNGDGAWVKYDLGSNQRLAYISLAFASANVRTYTFDVQTSTDNVAWSDILPGHKNPRELGLQVYDIADLDPVRYVRIVCHGSTYNAGLNSLAEIELWGGAAGSATAPAISTQPASQTASAGSNVTFTVAATGAPAPAYQWKVDGEVISGATSASLVLNNVQAADAGTYTVVVSNSSGSVTSSNAVLTVGSGSLGLDLQAENAVLSGALVKSNQTGYTGTGFADYINASADYVEWTASNPSAATRTLTFRYASTGLPRNLSITVNGVVVNSALAFTTTGGANIWALKTMTASLPAGTVLIRATATGTSGPNTDYLRID